MDDIAIQRALKIVAATQWHGDMRVNMKTAIDAGRVLARRVGDLERIIVESRREFRKGKSAPAFELLFDVDIDEEKYTSGRG